MKKLIGFIFCLTLALGVSGQVTMQKHFANTNVSVDTVTNTGTNFIGNLRLIGGPQSTVTVQANLTKISGTVAGTVTLQGSLDGTNFVTVTGTTTGVQTGAFTATNVTSQSTAWTLVGNPYSFYRVSWTGSGTMAAKLAGLIVAH